MKTAYALFSHNFSPIRITHPKLVKVYESRKEAAADALKRNESPRVSSWYFVQGVPFAKATGEKS